MKDWTYNKICQGEQIINDGLNRAKTRKATDETDILNDTRKRLNELTKHKTFPIKYHENLHSILWFSWKREILNNILYPYIWNNKLYCKWDAMPKRLKKHIMKNNYDNIETTKIFKWNFKNKTRNGINKTS